MVVSELMVEKPRFVDASTGRSARCRMFEIALRMYVGIPSVFQAFSLGVDCLC